MKSISNTEANTKWLCKGGCARMRSGQGVLLDTTELVKSAGWVCRFQ